MASRLLYKRETKYATNEKAVRIIKPQSDTFILGMAAAAKVTLFASLLLSTSSAFATSLHVGDGDGMVALNMMVAGRATSFTIDTGAMTTTIEPTEASLQYRVISSNTSTLASGAQRTCDVVQMPPVTFDAARMNDLTATRCPGANNLLGINALNNKVFTLQFSRAQFSVFTAAPVPVPWELSRPGGLITIPISVGWLKGAGLFDSGWSVTAVDFRLFEAHPEIFTATGEAGTSQDPSGNAFPYKIYRATNFKVGTLDFGSVLIESVDMAPLRTHTGQTFGVVIGENVMSHADWVIDLQQNKWNAISHVQQAL